MKNITQKNKITDFLRPGRLSNMEYLTKIKIFSFLLLAALAGVASALDLSSYRKISRADTNAKEMIKNGSFEDPKLITPVNRISEPIVIRPGFGCNGNAGLRISVSPQKPIRMYETKIIEPVMPGKKYKLSVWLRNDPQNIRRNYLVFTAKTPQGKWVYEKNTTTLVKKDKGWELWENTFTTNGEEVGKYRYSVVIGSFRGRKKTTAAYTFFDNLSMREDVPEWYCAIVWPTHHTLGPKNSKLRLSNTFVGPYLKKDALPLYLLEVFDAKGRKIAETVKRPNKKIVSARFDKLPECGKASLKVTLLDEKNRLIAGKKEFPIIIKKRTATPNACVIDSRGRAVINGKPFMPLGFWATWSLLPEVKATKLMEKFSEAGVNLVCSGHFIFTRQTPAQEKAYLDICRKNNIKVLVALFRHAYRDDAKSVTQMLKDVKRLKNNPSVLGWFMADEPSPSRMEKVALNRQLINNIDPDHPAIVNSDHGMQAHRFISGTDVYMHDPYPIKRHGATLRGSYNVARYIAGTGTPYWVISQAFNWGNHQPDKRVIKDLKLYNEFIEPTENQMLANALLHGCLGAKGFILFSWGSLFKGPVPKLFPQREKAALNVIRELKTMEKFILAEKDPEVLKVKFGKGLVRAFLFKADDGRRCVVLIGIDAKNQAEIMLPPEFKNWKSRYGKTVLGKNGMALYSGPAISCDILDE